MTDLSKTHPLNAKQVRTAFGISQVTLYLWRKGTEKRTPLPCKEIMQGGAARVGFKQADLEKWAKKHGVAIKVPFDQVIQQQALHAARPGPKPATAPAAAKKSQQSSGKGSVRPAKKQAAPAKPVAKPVAAKKKATKSAPAGEPALV